MNIAFKLYQLVTKYFSTVAFKLQLFNFNLKHTLN